MGRHVGLWPACPRCAGSGFEVRREWAVRDGEPVIRTVPDHTRPCEVCRGHGQDPFA